MIVDEKAARLEANKIHVERLDSILKIYKSEDQNSEVILKTSKSKPSLPEFDCELFAVLENTNKNEGLLRFYTVIRLCHIKGTESLYRMDVYHRVLFMTPDFLEWMKEKPQNFRQNISRKLAHYKNTHYRYITLRYTAETMIPIAQTKSMREATTWPTIRRIIRNHIEQSAYYTEGFIVNHRNGHYDEHIATLDKRREESVGANKKYAEKQRKENDMWLEAMSSGELPTGARRVGSAAQ